MRGGDNRTGELFSYVDLEARVRRDHPLRRIRAIVNEALAALETYSTGDEAEALRQLADAFADVPLGALADSPVAESFVVAACAAVGSERA